MLLLPKITRLQPLKVLDIAQLLDGEVIGDGVTEFTGVSKIDQSVPGSLSFLANPKYEEYLSSTTASVILVNSDENRKAPEGKVLIAVEDPYLGFCHILNVYFNQNQNKNGIHQSASINEKACIGDSVYIGANSTIEEGANIGDGSKIYPNCFVGANVEIGTNTVIYPGVNIYYDSEIGDNCIIHSGTVIGSDGFGHAPKKDGTYMKIPQIGNVVIENDVEIGSNCSIDRATLGSTIIRNGCRLDNLIQVAHNVEIGENTVIAGQAGVSGSTVLGNNCVIGGQVGFAGHLKIADRTQVGAQSGLAKSVEEPNQRLFGSPAVPLNEALRTHMIVRNLPDMKKRLDRLEKDIKSKEEE